MFVAKTKNYFIACNFQRTPNFNHALRFQTKVDAEQAIHLYVRKDICFSIKIMDEKEN